jgi:DNA-binding response OmpR family regulator
LYLLLYARPLIALQPGQLLNGESDRRTAPALGAVTFIMRPIAPLALLAAVQDCLQQQHGGRHRQETASAQRTLHKAFAGRERLAARREVIQSAREPHDLGRETHEDHSAGR